jgi:hypothetical protein
VNAAILTLIFGLNVPCTAPPGTFVAWLHSGGGDGNAISFKVSGGSMQGLVISGSQLVVGPTGLPRIMCGSSHNISITATQK